ncbi:hypothetical protein AAH991_39130 [Microbispora sp. ZYX-F-249]|uniref:Uncharacterized protein n=1 Tax=Microbispora maris TaxID=3144104 RepID=A0ABV0B3N3_9ACTN
MAARGSETNTLRVQMDLSIDRRTLMRAARFITRMAHWTALVGAGHLISIWWWR